jgi:hypothetical protein
MLLIPLCWVLLTGICFAGNQFNDQNMMHIDLLAEGFYSNTTSGESNYTLIGAITQSTPIASVLTATGETTSLSLLSGYYPALAMFRSENPNPEVVNFKTRESSFEEYSGTVTIDVVLNKPASQDITLTIGATPYTPASSNDYELGTTATIAEGMSRCTVSFSIVNDDLKEANERVKLAIDAATPSNVIIGQLSSHTVSIKQNDAYAITGTVKYNGKQCGTLNVKVINTATQAAVTEKSYSWVTVVKNGSMSYGSTTYSVSDLISGTYAIQAYIDSYTAGTRGAADTWEPIGEYNGTVECTNNQVVYNYVYPGKDIVLSDPAYITTTQAWETAYENWATEYFDDFSCMDNPDADCDKDGYSNIVEFNNGTDPLSPNVRYLYADYNPNTDEDNLSQETTKYQIVYPNPRLPQSRPGESFLVDVIYDTSDDNNRTTGLGLAIHYDSTVLTFAGFTNMLSNATSEAMALGVSAVYAEGTRVNDDGFSDTNTVVTIAWGNSASNWPGETKLLPAQLFTMKFNVDSEFDYGQRSVVRFTTTSKDIRYQFYGSPVIFEASRFNLDIDSNGNVDALTDGMLVLRYLFGLIDGEESEEDAIASNATRRKSEDILDFLTQSSTAQLDFDGNNDADALTDGLLLIRHLFELSGNSLTENAIGDNATRSTSTTIVPYIEQLIPKRGFVTPGQ